MLRDPELPNGFQDADFEMRALTRLGNRAAALRKKGICTHGWIKAPAFQPAVCLHCGKTFANEREAWAEGKRLLRGE